MNARRALRTALASYAFAFLGLCAAGQTDVRFGVLGLFHPRELVVEPIGFEAIVVIGGETPQVLNGEPGHRSVLFRAVGDRVIVASEASSMWTAAARDHSPVAFRLSVPGRIRRTYQGRLTITAHHGELLAVVAIEREQAVASILSAEMAHAPLEALKAQAVVTRSFLAAGGRHRAYDFCDTTHCQFLRSPADASANVKDAVIATHNLILSYRERPVAAMYSSRCGGQTHSLREVGLQDGDGYPYYSVQCRWCRQSAFHWRRRLDPATPAPQQGNEPARIAHARVWGWGSLPGSDFSFERGDEGMVIQGHSVGHGVGMCQFGAAGMARDGADFRAILAHYYPNTALIGLREPH